MVSELYPHIGTISREAMFQLYLDSTCPIVRNFCIAFAIFLSSLADFASFHNAFSGLPQLARYSLHIRYFAERLLSCVWIGLSLRSSSPPGGQLYLLAFAFFRIGSHYYFWAVICS